MNTKMDKPGEPSIEQHRDLLLDFLLDKSNNLQNINSIEDLHHLQELAHVLKPALVCKMHFLRQVSPLLDSPKERAMIAIEIEETEKKSSELHQGMLGIKKRVRALTNKPS